MMDSVPIVVYRWKSRYLSESFVLDLQAFVRLTVATALMTRLSDRWSDCDDV